MKEMWRELKFKHNPIEKNNTCTYRTYKKGLTRPKVSVPNRERERERGREREREGELYSLVRFNDQHTSTSLRMKASLGAGFAREAHVRLTKSPTRYGCDRRPAMIGTARFIESDTVP